MTLEVENKYMIGIAMNKSIILTAILFSFINVFGQTGDNIVLCQPKQTAFVDQSGSSITFKKPWVFEAKDLIPNDFSMINAHLNNINDLLASIKKDRDDYLDAGAYGVIVGMIAVTMKIICDYKRS